MRRISIVITTFIHFLLLYLSFSGTFCQVFFPELPLLEIQFLQQELNNGSGMFEICRSATGEAWQEIMLSCSDRDEVKCDPASDDYKQNPDAKCGVDFAYPYFISFFMLCSFLVILTYQTII